MYTIEYFFPFSRNFNDLRVPFPYIKTGPVLAISLRSHKSNLGWLQAFNAESNHCSGEKKYLCLLCLWPYIVTSKLAISSFFKGLDESWISHGLCLCLSIIGFPHYVGSHCFCPRVIYHKNPLGLILLVILQFLQCY